MVWERDDNDNPWIGVACETEGGSLWFPCKDHLSDEPDSVRLQHDCSGRFAGGVKRNVAKPYIPAGEGYISRGSHGTRSISTT
ncbi:MAG: hypothetical protein MZV63_42475 [Marinilabiliales bacterium]|nr:hypothetical protein [Marinilabiliales bacterium]